MIALSGIAWLLHGHLTLRSCTYYLFKIVWQILIYYSYYCPLQFSFYLSSFFSVFLSSSLCNVFLSTILSPICLKVCYHNNSNTTYQFSLEVLKPIEYVTLAIKNLFWNIQYNPSVMVV